MKMKLLVVDALGCPDPADKYVFKNGRLALLAGGAHGEQPLAHCCEARRPMLKASAVVLRRGLCPQPAASCFPDHCYDLRGGVHVQLPLLALRVQNLCGPARHPPNGAPCSQRNSQWATNKNPTHVRRMLSK